MWPDDSSRVHWGFSGSARPWAVHALHTMLVGYRLFCEKQSPRVQRPVVHLHRRAFEVLYPCSSGMSVPGWSQRQAECRRGCEVWTTWLQVPGLRCLFANPKRMQKPWTTRLGSVRSGCASQVVGSNWAFKFSANAKARVIDKKVARATTCQCGRP